MNRFGDLVWFPVEIDEEAKKALIRFTEDGTWIWDHIDELRKQYPDKYVAVIDKKVVCSSTNMTGIVNQLTSKGINPGTTMVDFIRSEEYPFTR